MTQWERKWVFSQRGESRFTDCQHCKHIGIETARHDCSSWFWPPWKMRTFSTGWRKKGGPWQMQSKSTDLGVFSVAWSVLGRWPSRLAYMGQADLHWAASGIQIVDSPIAHSHSFWKLRLEVNCTLEFHSCGQLNSDCSIIIKLHQPALSSH